MDKVNSIRINCGSDNDYTDLQGNIWSKDQPYTEGGWGYVSGASLGSETDVKNTNETELYKSIRYDKALKYKFDNLVNGSYIVNLHFAEFFYLDVGQRYFDVSINGEKVLSRYDIIADQGRLVADVKQFYMEIKDNKLEITGVTDKTDAIICAVEILPAAQSQVNKVTANLPSGACISHGESIELYSTEGAEIYFTMDRSDPKNSPSRQKYDGPILLNDDVTLKAYATCEGYYDSNVSLFSYRLVPIVPAVQGVGPSGRNELNLGRDGWRMWLDNSASWKNDTLYLPDEVYIPGMPINPPTVGWNHMYSNKGIEVSVPASVEEYFGNGINTYTYHGVFWLWKTIDVPKDWAEKTVRLMVGKARLRVEIYINEQLAGYDLVADTPFEFNVSDYLKYGEKNRIVLRITNPGGSRGWEDYWLVRWGNYILPSSHDYGDLGGEVTLVATNNTYIDNIFVKNLLPVGKNNIEVIATINNRQEVDVPLDLTVNILPCSGGPSIFTETYKIIADKYTPSVKGFTATEIIKQITVPDAKLWDIENPNLYNIEVLIGNSIGIRDSVTEIFGFRVFEVKEVNGKHRLFFNGKRIRHRSAIDWSYYVPGGNYAIDETALKSVKAAKDIGHNGINFHRRIGEPLVFKYANEIGLYMYEEPGGFHIHQGEDMTVHPFAVEIMKQKIMRMVKRDRNHPSLIWYNLCNEDNDDDNPARMWALKKIAQLDGTRMTTNSSQDDNIKLGHIKHIRPYESEIRLDYYDLHTIENKARFDDDLVFNLNNTTDDSRIWYWGESGCFTGPSNWYAVADMQNRLTDGRVIYDMNIYKPLHDKIKEYFDDNDIKNTGSKNIQTPEDVSRQAGRGIMYADGRIGQSTMIWDSEDGFAINGWTNGPMLPDEWDSALCDEGRNLKGPAEDYAYWVRELQIAILRKNGKYFNPGETAKFSVHIINEGKLAAGDYTLDVKVKDGNGNNTAYSKIIEVRVEGGDTYGQKLNDELEVTMDESWKGGYITIQAKLFDKSSAMVTDGAEQVIFKNRALYRDDIVGLKGAVYNWPSAMTAITQAQITIPDYSDDLGQLSYIAAGEVLNQQDIDGMLKRVHDDGTVLLIKFNQEWADKLYEKSILSQNVTEWGGTQTDSWKGNGWGYVDYFIGNQAVPSGSTISTNGWEVPSDPQGFYPFKSEFPTNAYGAFMARHDDFKVLIGTINYGKGKIVLAPSYPVDDDNGFNDMLFFNFITMSCR